MGGNFQLARSDTVPMLTQADVHWIELDSVDSTNHYLSRAYQQGRVSGITAVLAHAQTAGKGRAGRIWHAVPGSSLCLSLGLPLAAYSLPCLPLCVGVAAAQIIEQLGVSVHLKWPNDLLVNQKKLGGVLCESFQCGTGPVTVIGLGLNIKAHDVPDALGGQGATSLSNHLEVQAVPSAQALARKLVPTIVAWVDACIEHGIQAVLNEFAQRDVWQGFQVQALDNGTVRFKGTAMGVNEQGAYLIDTGQGVVALNSGDLSLRAQS